MDFLKSFRPKKISWRLIFSYGLFLLFMSMDFFSTDWLSQGDISIEGNQIARLWWTLTGELHTILAIPIWLTYIFGIAFILNMKSEFLALWWINEIAFQHLIGWISWSPYYRMLDFYYSAIGNTWALNFAETFLGLFIGLLVSVCLIKLGRDRKNKLEIN